MNVTVDNAHPSRGVVDELPELPEPVHSSVHAAWGPKPDYYTADQMHAYACAALQAAALPASNNADTLSDVSKVDIPRYVLRIEGGATGWGCYPHKADDGDWCRYSEVLRSKFYADLVSALPAVPDGMVLVRHADLSLAAQMLTWGWTGDGLGCSEEQQIERMQAQLFEIVSATPAHDQPEGEG